MYCLPQGSITLIEGRFTLRTMNSDHGRCLIPWSEFMVRLPWSELLKNQFTRFMGPSLGVNRMWTKRNDHAPKSGCASFLNIYPKGQFWFFFMFSLIHQVNKKSV